MSTWLKTKKSMIPDATRAQGDDDFGAPGCTPTVRILIADDHPVVRKGLTNFLARQSRLKVIGEAVDGNETVAKARQLSPDLVLMDIDMPKLNGLTATEILRRENPKLKILILSAHRSAHYAVQILKSGACGSVSKEASTDELLRAIQTVANGGSYFNSETAKAALQYLSGVDVQGQGARNISLREREVLVAITDGLRTKEIAHRLGISLRSVETHRERIMRKLGIRSVAELTRFAILQGLIIPPRAT
jgi:DNA-binding NarL/FixJ family response regulator